ncbi:MAG TPA: histidinol-phosphate transaminase [Polyangiaceae bacterium]|nr:histidinol-phosphate transaminase [Polyangiaceae bacterium]
MGLVTDSIAQLKPYEPGKPLEELERELGVTNAVKLASNENPLGPSPRALAAAHEALLALHRYPDAAQHSLRHRLATFLGVEPTEIALGAGSNELLDLLVRTFCTSQHHVVFAEPSFVVYRMACLAHGVPCTAVPLTQDLRHDLPAMAAAVRSETRLIFIANPNNPTGSYVSLAELSKFLQQVPREVIVALDEAYIEYATADDFPNGLQLRELHPQLVCLRTFSKAYGLAALRLGYAIAPKQLVHYLDCVRAPFNVNSVAQAAGIAALDDQKHVQQVTALNGSERERLTQALTQRGIRVWPSQANFVLIDLARPAQPIYQALLNTGVIVRPMPSLPTSLRVTVGVPEENQRFLSALDQVLQ